MFGYAGSSLLRGLCSSCGRGLPTVMRMLLILLLGSRLAALGLVSFSSCARELSSCDFQALKHIGLAVPR